MRIHVTQAVLTAMLVRPATSPATPDVGNVAVTQAVLTALAVPASSVRVTEALLTAVASIGGDADTPGSGTPTAVTHSFGYTA